MASLEDVVTSIGPVRAHVRAAYEEIIRACPYTIFFAWGAPGRGTGDHAVGLALDIMNYSLGGGVNSPGPERREVQNWVKAYALQHRVRLGLTYVIADRQIASDESDPDWSWRRYTRSDPHTNHVHISFKATHTYHEPPEDDDMANAQEVLEAVASLRAYVREAYLDTTNKLNTFDERERNRDAAQDAALARLEAAVAKLAEGSSLLSRKVGQ